MGVGTMETPGCNSLWDLLRADSGEAERARRRLGVGLALAVLLSGLLTAVGLAIVVLGASLFVVTLLMMIAAARALSRNRRRLQKSAYSFVTSLTRTSSRQGRRAGTHLRKRASRLVRTSVVRASQLRTVAEGSIARGVEHTRRARASLQVKQRDAQREALRVKSAGTRPRRGGGMSHLGTAVDGWIARSVEHAQRARASLPVKQMDVQREALRLNSAGTRQRRSGAPAAAIELHTRALELLRETQDLRAVALTQNNLALALSHVGDDRAATALFEQAAATVRELGDREHEGRIMANLALAHRRHGRLEQCEDILRIALTKLRRDSTAYKRVEAELSGGT